MKRLHDFGTRNGESRRLGGEFTRAVREAHFFGGAEHELIRYYSLATNLVAKHVSEGIGKTLVKSDTRTLSLQEMHKPLQDVASLMQTVREITCTKPATKMDVAKRYELEDITLVFWIRCVLHLLKKGSASSFDNMSFSSIADIKTAFVQKMLDAKLQKLLPSRWEPPLTAAGKTCP